MARIRNDQLTEKEKKTISKRIKSLYEERNFKDPSFDQKKLAELLGISESAISRMLKGDNITLKNLIGVSSLFNVSMDYLSGKTESKTIDIEKKAIAEKLNLSDKAVNNLIGCNSKRALSVLLEYQNFDDFFFDLWCYLFATNDQKLSFVFRFDNEKTIINTAYIKKGDIKTIFLERIKKHLNIMLKGVLDGKK